MGKLDWQPGSTLEEWLAGKRPEELDVIELQGRPLYLDAIKRRDPKTRELKEVPVRVRVPNTLDKATSRLDALKWAQKIAREKDMPPPLDLGAAERMFGSAYFDEMDSMALLARCTLDVEPPHAQFMLVELLVPNYERGSLLELWARLNLYLSWETLQVEDITEERFLKAVAAIDTVRNLSPLVGIVGAQQDSFIISMAVRLQSYLTPKPSSPSTESSTPTGPTGASS